MSWAAARPQLGKVGCVCLTLAAAMACAVQEACAIMASVLEDSVPAEGRTKGRLYELARIRCCCCQLAPLAIRSPSPLSSQGLLPGLDVVPPDTSASSKRLFLVSGPQTQAHRETPP